MERSQRANDRSGEKPSRVERDAATSRGSRSTSTTTHDPGKASRQNGRVTHARGSFQTHSPRNDAPSSARARSTAASSQPNRAGGYDQLPPAASRSSSSKRMSRSLSQ
jgi:hypothetical protein